jgi:predicted amidohydrolase YtcJ
MGPGPVNPVWLTQTTNRYGVANTAALKLAGITRDTKDPPAGTIDRDSRGNPTGVLKESAQGLVASKVPPLTREQEKNGIIKIIQEFNREGMTAAKDPGIGQARWALYEELLREGKLTVRVCALWVVDSYAEALAAKPTKGLRHGLIHANTPTDHANDVMARLQRDYDAGYPEAQATFLWWIGDNYAGNLGPKRALRLKPFKTWVNKGIKWAGGSDYPVTPFPARHSLWASVTRTTLNGTHGSQPFGTSEAIDIRTALRAQSIWAAHQMFLDDRIGSLEVGKQADLAVWDRDLYTVPGGALKDLKAELTLVDGEVVFHDTGSPVTIK